ncbi:hypothetical protein [Roseibium sp.]|uniref:hypothetical protein n=1 Tax=Roseibium sp. TaxID=1936156 RepID=UPI003D0DC98F
MTVTACLKLLMLPAVLIGALAMEDSVAAQDRLPDGDVAKLRHNGTTYAAWYGTPTDRYGHAILGDGIEGGSLHLKVGGNDYTVTLPHDQVFEDRTPRIVDLNGDGKPEIVTIRAFLSAGASVAVFGLRADELVEVASSRPIGRTNRWLNIAGIADYLGTGQKQIAFVETPHIGGTLQIARWQGNKLELAYALRGFSNHKIGAREQNLSATVKADAQALPFIILPSNNRRVLHMVGYKDGEFRSLGQNALTAPVARHIPGAQTEADCAVFELENGEQTQMCASDINAG